MRRFIILILATISFFCGCATTVRVKQMIPDTKDINFQSTGKTITVAPVSGGEEDSFWEGSKISADKFQKALLESLQQSNLFTEVKSEGTATYQLETHVMSQDQPIAGLNMTVTLKALYRIIDLSTNNKVYEKLVSSKFTATFGSALAGSTRLIKANEGAVRENIKSFLNGLAQATL